MTRLHRGTVAVRGLILAMLALFAWGTAAAVATASAPATPTATAHDFYVWYVGALAHDKEPMTDAPQALARFVDPTLIARIKHQQDGPDGMDADYFIKAQDYMDEWVNHVVVSAPVMTGHVARVVVTLGAEHPPYRLTVLLGQQGGLWRITRVTKG